MALATNTQPGEIQLAGDLAGNNDATAPELSPSGVIAGQYTLPQLTVDGKGRVTNAQGGDPSTISALLQNASDTQKGVVQAGAGLDVTTNGSAGYQDVIFSTSITGAEATGLDACASYLIDINVDALPAQQIVVSGGVTTIQDVVDKINLSISGAIVTIVGGVVRFTSNTSGRDSVVEIINDAIFGCMSGFDSIDAFVRGFADCEMFAADATVSSKGIVQIGANIDVVAGVISIAPSSLDVATTTTLGGVIVPISGNIDVNASGAISVPISTGVVLGVVKIPGGDGLAVDGSGNLTFTTSNLADATAVSKGVVQIGANIDVASGVISVGVGSGVAKGVVQIDTTNGLSVSSGIVDINIAGTSNLGVVKIPGGDGLAVDGSGNLTFTPGALADATAISKGVVQIGANISVASGVISVADGTSAVKGVVNSADTSNITITAGAIDVGSNIGQKDTANIWTATQSVALNTLTYGATVNVDASLSNVFQLVATGNFTLANPSNLVAGGRYTFIIKQDATGSRVVTYGTAYKFKAGSINTLTTTANSSDILTCLSDGTDLYCALAKEFV